MRAIGFARFRLLLRLAPAAPFHLTRFPRREGEKPSLVSLMYSLAA